MSGADKGRLGRWSRLKQQKKADAALADAETQVAGLTEGPDTGGTPAADAPVEPVVDLPPVESLGKDSDYTPFLQEGVPEDLAKAALRKMWRSDPAFNIRDGLDDYDEDFNIIETLVKAVTSKRGKGKKKTAKKEPAKGATETKKAGGKGATETKKAGAKPKKLKKAKPPKAQKDKGETRTAEVSKPSGRGSS